MNTHSFFDEFLKNSGKELKNINDKDFKQVFESISKNLVEIMQSNEVDNINHLNQEYENFNKRNYSRWEKGFDKLEMLREISIEAGMEFKKEFSKYSEYENDALLGVLMRQHANACRITGEIIHLLKGGYSDGAIARWRTLFEIAVTSLVLNRHGKECAVDYIKYGKLKSIEGMEEYQKTAKEMKVEPYSKEEMDLAIVLKEELKREIDYSWAKKYTNFGKMEKLREYVGLEKWSHYYMLASKIIHADFHEMNTLMAMSEAKEKGQSNSGMTEPAHITAITLNQITSAFLTAYIKDENTKIDYKVSMLFLSLLKQYSDDVGKEFLKCEKIIKK